MNKMIELDVKGLTFSDKVDLVFCEDCAMTKSHEQNRSTKPREKSTKPLGRLNMDMWEMKTPSHGGNRYVLSLIDDATGMVWTYFMKKKSEATQRLREFYNTVVRPYREESQAKYNTDVEFSSRIRTDNDKVFKSEEFRNDCIHHGFITEFAAPYSQHQNGVAERMWNT
jgi:transposase InsO family protein